MNKTEQTKKIILENKQLGFADAVSVAMKQVGVFIYAEQPCTKKIDGHVSLDSKYICFIFSKQNRRLGRLVFKIGTFPILNNSEKLKCDSWL